MQTGSLARLPGRVTGPVQKERNQALHRLGRVMKRAAFSRYLGQTVDVLLEKAQPLEDNKVLYFGYTPNYLRVEVCVPESYDLENRIVPVDLTDLSEQLETLKGTISSKALDALLLQPKLQTKVSKSTLLHVVGQH